MIYFVELAFSQPEREAEWNHWYSTHLDVLLSVPGFSTAQRFVSTMPCRAPYLAAYSVTDAAVFDSVPYRQRGGRGSPGAWAPLMINWDRNLFGGLAQMPAVGPEQYLAVMDDVPGLENDLRLTAALAQLVLAQAQNISPKNAHLARCGFDQQIGRAHV